MNHKYHSPFIKGLLCGADALLIYAAFYISIRTGVLTGSDRDLEAFGLIFAFSWISIGLFSSIYEIGKYSLLTSISINLLMALLLHLLLINILLAGFNLFPLSRETLLWLYFATGSLMVISRVAYKLLWKFFEFAPFNIRRVVIVGTTHSGKALHEFLTTQHATGYLFKGFFDNYPNPEIIDRKFVKGTIDDLLLYCQKENIDEIYFTLPLVHKDLIDRLRTFADDNCIYFRIASDFSEVVHNIHNVFLYDTIAVSTTRREPLGDGINVAVKRTFDIVFSIFVLLFIFPIVVPVIAVAIKLDSPGPLIFKQLRPGKRNKLFECYKFRTMRVNSSTETMATRDDDRVTGVGAFLRKTSLDELPQFINVLFGSMSVVGPRPNLASQLEEYSRTIKRYKVRHFVTPGITGYAQVNGYRGEIKEKGSMERRVDYDVAYMENWSLMLDLKIIFRTLQKIWQGDEQAY